MPIYGTASIPTLTLDLGRGQGQGMIMILTGTLIELRTSCNYFYIG